MTQKKTKKTRKIKKTKKIQKSYKNPYYSKVMKSLLNKIDKRKFDNDDKKLLSNLLNNLKELCEYHYKKNN